MENGFNILEAVKALLKPGCIYDDEIAQAWDILMGLVPKCQECAEANQCRPRTAMKIAMLVRIWNILESVTDDDDWPGGFMGFIFPPIPDSWKGELGQCPKKSKEGGS